MKGKCGRGFSLEKKQSSKQRKRGGGLYLRPYGMGRGLSFLKKQNRKKYYNKKR